MYPIEYMCTNEDTTRTGINIETVKESKLKLHSTFNDSESIHLKSFMDTGMLFKPTSKKANVAKMVVVTTDVHAITCDPLTPIFLPKKPEDIEDSKGSIIIIKYII
jgi:hypothetical protein